MILINSAEFDYAEIDLNKDMFFAGDNGTGKTSSIIALFYLFSGDNNSRKLGISSDKKTFKEYYFPDEKNSFIIYIFNDFFIFMYKQNGEVFKRFSKKVFEIEKIIKEDGELRNFKDIQSYLKDAPLTHLAKSSEYREIIYGQNRRILDFKITNIKNYDVFVELFNQTFNVDKSIVDANSIKRAIQKSLNVEEKNIEFNYQNYMEEIKKFQDSYLFFSKFEKDSKKIADTFKLQEELLRVEEKINELGSNIRYRQAVEVELLEEKKRRVVRLKELSAQYHIKREQKEKSLNRVRERFAKEIATLEKEISDIEELKIKFDPEIHHKQQTLFNQLPTLEKEYNETQQRLTLLEADIINSLNSIDQEISALRFKRDNDLVQEKRVKLQQLKTEQNEQLSLEKERLRNEREHTEHKIESQRSTLKLEIEEQEQQQEDEKSKANEINNEFREKLNLFNEKQFKIKSSLQEDIAQEEEHLRGFKKELKLLDEKRDSLTLKQQKEKKELAQKLWRERQRLNAIIKNQKNILWTEEGSFKEFLQQSGISWERELYPFMDASLLSMSVDRLLPKVINTETPLGIEINTKELKRIPTAEEAEESIREAKVKKRQLLQLYKEEKTALKTTYLNEIEEIEKSFRSIEYNLKTSKEKIEKTRQEITKINTITIPEYRAKLDKEKTVALSVITKNIEKSITEIKKNKALLRELNEELKGFIKAQQVSLNDYLKELKEKEKKEKKRIENSLKDEQKKIDKLITEKQKNRKNLSKDEVIDSLKRTLNRVQERLTKSRDAKYYLEEYEKQKEFIDSLSQKKSRLIMTKQNRNNLENKINKKQDEILKSVTINEEAINTLNGEINKLKIGLEKSKNIKIDTVETKESETYLSELIVSYKSNQTSYKELRVNLKERLSSLNSLKNNPFSDINFNLENFSIFEHFSEDSETLERLSELKDFKEKKLKILKETTNEKYFNFIKSEIPSKLGSLSHSEDKFQEQVKKINKNLSTIDFGIIKGIKINPEIGNKRSIMSLLNELNKFVQNINLNNSKESLFFDKPKTNQDLQKIATLLSEIKETLKGGAITLLDTIDLSLEFIENGTKKSNVTQIKNESSTGGTILLKMALAVSILGLYTQEKESTFFLILDEVSRLHSHNQDLLRAFANSRGFRVVFVTPEPIYAKPDEIKYYKFMRREDNRFEIVGLNV
ncbi:Chromosome partition protein smc [hydrothermal vent metagenome]|uniref:Chromosome partition protein smc n=1 Tax=hydrothermal vent metagenome TaxID=652676 RepID=A0A1W1C9R7_9ZZZZ